MNKREFLRLALANHATHADWRWGQALYNTLHDVRPDLADEIHGTELDTFYAPSGAAFVKLDEFLDERLEASE